MKLKRFLSLCMALVLTLGALGPAIVAEAAVVDPEDYKIYHQMGVGDVVDLSTFSVDTPEAIDEYLDVLQDMGYQRIYWRGLEQAIMTEQLVVRPEAAVRLLRNTHYGYSMYWEGNSFDDPNTAAVETIDQYLVREAHKRGMEVIGQCKWGDYGGFGDSSYLPFPYGMYSYHKEHPEWAPVDEWGLMTQGGAVEFSYPEAREYVVNMIMEEVEKAGYDGVLFIGYTENYDLKFEDQFGYNDPAVEEFKNRYGRTPEMDGLNYNVSLEHWRMLRGEYLTQFLRDMKESLEAYSADSGNGDILAININSSKPRQPEIWSSYNDSLITNNAYLDLETYAKEGIVDELHVKGNTDLAKQTKLIDDLIWLCRGTDTQVVITSSVVDHTNFGMGFLWESYLKQGVAIENFYTLADGSGPNGNFLANDHSIYKCGPDISDKISTMSEESQLRYYVSRVANGYEQATFEELKGWILGGGVMVPRMAMSALLKYYSNDSRTAGVLEEVLKTSDQIGVRGLALRYIGVYNCTTPTMLDTILDCIDKDYAMGTFDCGKMALQRMDKDALWTAFADPNSSLRTKAMILEALNGTVLNAEQIAYLHDHMVGNAEDNWKTAYRDIYSDDPDAVLEASYKNFLRYYGVALTYHAVRGEASKTALQYLLEFMASDDTVIAGQAIDTVDTGITAGLTQFTDEWKAEVAVLLKERFADLSTAVDYGKGSTYAVSDWNEWAYRLIGRSLLSLGETGKAVMQEFYTGNDPKLALYAFKCMYLPVDEYKAIYMTYDEYKEAYSHLPRVLNAYKTVKIEQDFEDTSLFHAASSGHFGNNAATEGRWSFIGSNTKISTDNVRSGEQSVLLSGNMTGNEGSAVNNTTPVSGKDYLISAWIYHEGGTFNISTAVSGTNGNKFSEPAGAEVFVRIDNDGKVWFYDYANGETPALKDTGLTVQKDKWTQISIESIRSNDLNKAVITVRPEGGEAQSTERYNMVSHDDVMILRMTHQGDNATYVDDVLWLLPESDLDAAAVKVITLESDSVVYDGNAHSLTAVTTPAGLNVNYSYKDSNGNILTEKPKNAGVYTVTATVADNGYGGASATATLEIRRAPTQITGTVTATPVKLGEPLCCSKLSGVTVVPYGGGDALQGSIAWDNPGFYCKGTDMQTFTFTPDNPNYKPAKGTALVSVIGDDVLVLKQNFDDTRIFKTDATGEYTAGSADTVGGSWTLDAQNANGGAIYDVTGIGGSGQAVRVTRNNANEKLVVSVNNGVTGAEDFVLSFRMYHTGTNSENTIIELPGGTIYFMNNGYIRLGTSKTTFFQYTLTPNKWSTVTVKSDRANGKYSVTVQPDGGDPATFTHTLDNTAITNIPISCAANNTSSSYIDDIQLTKAASAMTDAVVLEQGFNDTETFKTDATGEYTAGSADTVGGSWTLDAQNTNGGAIYDVTGIGGSGQAVRVTRNNANEKLVVSVNNGVTGAEDFVLSFRMYHTGTESENTAIELPGGTIYFMNNGYIRLGTSQTTFFQYTLTPNKWSTVTVKSDRANGKYSVTVQPDGGDPATFTHTLDNTAITSIPISCAANNTSSSYIDDIRLTKAVPARVDDNGNALDYVVAVNPEETVGVLETVSVQVNVISTTKTTYNAFRYELSYDADMLAYAGVTEGVTVDSSTPGKLIVTGSGKDWNISDTVDLTFTAKQRGTTKVKLDKAYVDAAAVSNIESTGADLITFGETTITASGYVVTLSADFKGAEYVSEGADYTFTARNPHYDYTFTGSTMGGAAAAVIDNGNATFTVKAVSGDLAIVSQKSPKRFRVSVDGSGKADVTANTSATYGVDYSFTVNGDEDYDYSVKVTVNGANYIPENSGTTYTVAGKDIVGDIVITVTKTANQQLPQLSGNLTLNETIRINVVIPSTVDVTDAVYVVKNLTTGASCDYTRRIWADGSTVIGVAVTANRMTEVFSIQVFDKNGNPLTQEAQVSIRSYTHKILDAYMATDPTLCAMLVAMLDYGALAQIYSGTNTADLANRYVTAQQRAVLTTYPWPEN